MKVRSLFSCALGAWLFAAAPLLHAIEGSVRVVTFTGAVTGKPVTFSLYLPPGYDTSTNRYPTVVHLHGIGGRHDGPQTNLVPANLEEAVAAGGIEPCIVVFPDGYGDSFWADSVNSAKPAETNVREEIIPYLDAHYRTIANRSRRVIQGFSMGGFGAAKFATKFPDLFAGCVIYDGAMLNWSQVQQRHSTQAAEIFNNDEATFNLFSSRHWLAQNTAVLRATMPFRQVVGALVTDNRDWRDLLVAASIVPSYVETGLAHSLGPLLDVEGSNSWAFIAGAFAGADALPVTRLVLLQQQNHAILRWPSQAGEKFDLEHRTDWQSAFWQALATNRDAGVGTFTEYTHSNALLAASGFYRVRLITNSNPVPFTFTWNGTNFTYTDTNRTFTGIMLKPQGEGPHPAVVINHGAGGSASGYSLQKAREMLPWGLLCIAPNLTHVAGGETNAVNMGFCPENLERIRACLNVLQTLNVDTNRAAIFGHSMGGFAAIGAAAELRDRLRAAVVTGSGIIPDSAGITNAAPTVTEASPARSPFLMIHCDADPVVPQVRSQLLQQVLNSNSVAHDRILISSNSIANASNWHNIHNDSNANTLILTNSRAWLQNHGVLP